MELPTRKQNRLKKYDYSTPNAYFITICTVTRKNLFWMDEEAINDRPYNINGSQVNEGNSIQTSWIYSLAKRFLRSCD